ncbi:MAG: hypothetical protein LBH82_06010 [Bacteroidales bacterium]|jgi:hypothetical protein|nr:hypothetical protein [Bacteroidales bacterium]
MAFRYFIRLVAVLLFVGTLSACASKKYPPKQKRKKCDCPKFSHEHLQKNNDHTKTYDYIG